MNEWLEAYLRRIEGWFGPPVGPPGIDPSTAEEELGLKLPAVLREVYVRTGNRDEVHRVQDFLVPPDELQFDDDALVFYSENQGVCLWGLPADVLGEADPPVVFRVNDEAWRPESSRLSIFLDSMLAYQKLLAGPTTKRTGLDGRAVAALEAAVPPGAAVGQIATMGRWRWNDELVVLIDDREPPPSVRAAANTAQTLDRLGGRLGIPWAVVPPGQGQF